MGQVKKSMPPPTFQVIDTPEALGAFAAKAEKAKTVAVDLEADSMFHFQEKVCLIQMAANGHMAVIDPLPIDDLGPLRPIFANDGIRNVFHGADYDVRSLYRDYGIVINNLFDTQLASMYLGYKETGLESVVARHYGVHLDKKYQKKNWSQRPLPREMVSYAASDVAFLIQLADDLTEALAAKGRLNWVLEECRLLSRVRPIDNHQGPRFVRVKGAGRLQPRQLAVLEALLEKREDIARQKDRPLFKIISNTALLKLAMSMPASLDELKTTKILSPKQTDMYGQQVIGGIARARAVPDDELPAYPRQRTPRLSPRVPGRVKVLKTWRDETARRMDLDPALLFNRALLRELAVHKPPNIEALKAVPGIHRWQVDTYGKEIIRILKPLA